MKKLIALVLTVSVIVAMSVTSFAAATPSATGNTTYVAATETATDSFSVNAETIAANNNQTTIVVIKGVGVEEDGVTKYNISTDTIQYINQSADKTFSFIPKDHDAFKASEEDVTLTVLVGGDKISKQEAGTVVYTAEVSGGDEEPEYMLGDIFVDEAVDSFDLLLLDYYTSELYDRIEEEFGDEGIFWEDENDPRLLAADVFVDGAVDSFDLLLLDYYTSELYDRIEEEFGDEGIFWEE